MGISHSSCLIAQISPGTSKQEYCFDTGEMHNGAVDNNFSSNSILGFCHQLVF